MRQTIIDEVRAFNRWYTGIAGLLDTHILDSSFSLPEARVLYELYHHDGIQAAGIITLLGLDKGYLSRILDQFGKKALIIRKRSKEDGRVQHIFLTARGRAAFETLNRASHAQVKQLLAPLTAEDRSRLVHHMNEIKRIIIRHDNQ
jgi:DNA-binding MarR family transcriptional regulator